MKAIIHAKVILEDGILWDGTVLWDGKKILSVGRTEEVAVPADAEVIDAGGLYAAPGLVDIHNHGCTEAWFYEDPLKCCEVFLRHGVTTVLPTFLNTMSKETMIEGAEKIRKLSQTGIGRIMDGLYMEGPFMRMSGGFSSLFCWDEEIRPEDYREMLELYRSLVDLEPILHKPVRQMSLGQRTLSDILAAFLHNPGIVFLDEPTIGLDVSMKAKIRELIRGLNEAKQTTVILTTHDMGDVDALCRRIIIIDKGRKIYDNDIEHLKSYFGSYRTLRMRLSDDSWVEQVIDEKKTDVMHVMQEIQKEHRIKDIQLQEISTEEVIRKIYEGEESA